MVGFIQERAEVLLGSKVIVNSAFPFYAVSSGAIAHLPTHLPTDKVELEADVGRMRHLGRW